MGNILSPHPAVREHFITTGNPAGPKAETHRYKLTGTVYPMACTPWQTPPTSLSTRQAVTPFYTHCVGVVIFIPLKTVGCSNQVCLGLQHCCRVTRWNQTLCHKSTSHLWAKSRLISQPQTSLLDKPFISPRMPYPA